MHLVTYFILSSL